MLVTFTCNAYENITMFADVAKQLLLLMGHSGTIPSALLADEVPKAFSLLKKGVMQKTGDSKSNSLKNQSEQEDEPPIHLTQRAFPLLKMLEAAVQHHSDVLWDYSKY